MIQALRVLNLGRWPGEAILGFHAVVTAVLLFNCRPTHLRINSRCRAPESAA